MSLRLFRSFCSVFIAVLVVPFQCFGGFISAFPLFSSGVSVVLAVPVVSFRFSVLDFGTCCSAVVLDWRANEPLERDLGINWRADEPLEGHRPSKVALFCSLASFFFPVLKRPCIRNNLLTTYVQSLVGEISDLSLYVLTERYQGLVPIFPVITSLAGNNIGNLVSLIFSWFWQIIFFKVISWIK